MLPAGHIITARPRHPIPPASTRGSRSPGESCTGEPARIPVTLLADIAGALVVVEEASGELSPLLADAIEIPRLVAERHGAQRARLRWTEAAVRREFMIIREELERVVRASVPAAEALKAADAVATVNRFVDQAEYLSVRAHE